MRNFELNRILSNLPRFAIFYFDGAGAGAGGTGAGGSGDGGAAGGGGTGGAGGSGGSGGGAGSGAPAAIDWNTAPQQFRDGYAKMKADFEKLQSDYKPWQEWSTKVGVTHDQLPAVHGTYQEVYEQINGIAEELGLPEDQIAEAVDKHGIVKVLDHLRNQYAKAAENRDPDDQSLQDAIEAAISQRMGPIEERENQRLTDAGNDRFEQIVHSSIVDTFKAEGIDVAQIPEKESFMLMNATSEILKYDEKALTALKQGKGQAEVQRAFQQAKTFLDEYYLSRSGRERGRIQGPPRIKTPEGAQRKPTLDEMIEEPTNINTKYKVGT